MRSRAFIRAPLAAVAAFAIMIIPPGQAFANTQPVIIKSNMDTFFISWWPHEYCRETGRNAVECKDAAPNGSTVGFHIAGGGSCYVDFARRGGSWHLRGTRGDCVARVSGNKIIAGYIARRR